MTHHLVTRCAAADPRWQAPHLLKCPLCRCVAPLESYDVLGCEDDELACNNCGAVVVAYPVILEPVEMTTERLGPVVQKRMFE
jgi:hypothetical protein